MYIKITRKNLFDYIYLILGTGWLLLMMAVPRAYTNIKMGLLAILCGVSFLECLYRRTKVRTVYYAATIGFVGYFLLSLCYGILSGYKFESVDNALINYYLVTPIVSLFLGMIFEKESRWGYMDSFLIYGGTAIAVLNIGAILANFRVIPKFAIFNLMYVSSAVIKSNELSLRMSNEPTLIFILPYMITMLYKAKELKKSKRFCLYLGVIAGCSYAIISGRKSLEILIAGAFLILAARTMRKCSAQTAVKSIFAVVIGGIVLYGVMGYISEKLGINNIFQTAINTILYGLSSNAVGVNKRNGNMEALLNGWIDNLHTVFIGHGLNSYVETSLANKTTMWSYEVYYHALLYQCGIIGLVILVFALWSFVKPLWKRAALEHDNICFSYIVAILAFVVAGGTNPMLYYAWFWAFLWGTKIHYDSEKSEIHEYQ